MPPWQPSFCSDIFQEKTGTDWAAGHSTAIRHAEITSDLKPIADDAEEVVESRRENGELTRGALSLLVLEPLAASLTPGKLSNVLL